MPTPALAGDFQELEPHKPTSAAPFIQKTTVGDVPARGAPVTVPFITWAADGVTLLANGGVESGSSPLAKALGGPVKLAQTDDFSSQVVDYIRGRSPFLRGTLGMISQVSEALVAKDPKLEPVVIVQLSWSTGADGFVTRGVDELSALKGKSLVVQAYGPHLDLVQVLLRDAGLEPGDVTLRFVKDITATGGKGPPSDPAGALRADTSLAAAACILPDLQALTAGDKAVAGAEAILTTRTASRVIADVYAVRRDVFEARKADIRAFVAALLDQQHAVRGELANIARKEQADKARVKAFKARCAPLAKTFLQDASLVNDYILWLGIDSELAGLRGNRRFFAAKDNPVGFTATARRACEFFKALGFLAEERAPATAGWDWAKDFQGVRADKLERRAGFESLQAARSAAAGKDSRVLFRATFAFPAGDSALDWREHREVFETIHDKVSRYGGAVVQLRGHADNYFFNVCRQKLKAGATTFRRKTDKGGWETVRLPMLEEVLNSAARLSYERAFAMKAAYARYLVERHGADAGDLHLARFDARGMGLSDPIHKHPVTTAERAENMRGELVIIAAEAEVATEFDFNDF